MSNEIRTLAAGLAFCCTTVGMTVARAECVGANGHVYTDSFITAKIQSQSATNKERWLTYFEMSFLAGVDYFSFWDPDRSLPGHDIPNAPGTVYAKWMNAAFLAEYGIDSNAMPVTEGTEISIIGRPWHGRKDYRRNAKARRTIAHYSYSPRFIDGYSSKGALGEHKLTSAKNAVGDTTGSAVDSVFGSDAESVNLYCDLFSGTLAHPVIRSGLLVHEGQHSWEFRHQDIDNYGHTKCLNLYTIDGMPKIDCDTVHWHGRHDVAHGDMYKNIENPYQIEREYYCDVSEYPNGWVPADFRILASEWANYKTRQLKLDGGAPPICGNPYPFGRTSPEKAYCQEGWPCYCPQGSSGEIITQCGNKCVDLKEDAKNCGACGSVCDGACNAGICQPCQTGLGACRDDGTCVTGQFCNMLGCCELDFQ